MTDQRERCPNKDNHTPRPEGYMAWMSWADRMSKTHKQIKCAGCGRYTIWVPKGQRVSKELTGEAEPTGLVSKEGKQ